MTVKDVLNIFFMHPVKGLPVTDDRDERILGLIAKERIVEMGAIRADINIDISDTAGRLLHELNRKNIEAFFKDLDPLYAIPVINRKGEIRSAVTKTDLESRESAARETEAPQPAGTPRIEPAGTPRVPEQPFEILNAVPAAVLVLNPRQVILFANDFFLEKFEMERDLILRQQISRFFPRIKLIGSEDGIFSYGHKKWHFRLQPGLTENILVFQEVVVRNAPPEGDSAADKILSGTVRLKTLTEQFEARVIRKVYQRTKGNIRKSAELLGLPEETMKYRIPKTK